MTAQLNHTIVYASNPTRSALFLTELLGLAAPVRFGPFQAVELDNGVSLDFAAADGPIQPQHYAFLISEADFDAVFDRIRERLETNRRRALMNVIALHDRPVSLPLPIAYSGSGSPAIWRIWNQLPPAPEDTIR